MSETKPRKLTVRERDIWLAGLAAGLRSAARGFEERWKREISNRVVYLSLDHGSVTQPPAEWPPGKKGN